MNAIDTIWNFAFLVLFLLVSGVAIWSGFVEPVDDDDYTETK